MKKLVLLLLVLSGCSAGDGEHPAAESFSELPVDVREKHIELLGAHLVGIHAVMADIESLPEYSNERRNAEDKLKSLQAEYRAVRDSVNCDLSPDQVEIEYAAILQRIRDGGGGK